MRKRFSWLIIDLFLLLTFFLIFCGVFGLSHQTPVLVDIVFIILSHVILWIVILLHPKSKNELVHMSTAVPLCMGYILVEFLQSIILMLFAKKNLTATFIVQFSLLLVFAALLIIRQIATNDSIRQEKQMHDNRRFLDEILQYTFQIKTKATTEKEKSVCESLLDLIRSSQLQSSSSVEAIERSVTQHLYEASVCTYESDELCEKVNAALILLKQRNEILKNTIN